MPKRDLGEIFRRGRFYSIRYYDGRGRRRRESSKSERREDAERLLRKRLKAKDDGLPIDPQIGKLKFDDAATDLLNDYRVNGKKSLDEAERRVTKHLLPFFGGRRLSALNTSDVRAYVAKRQADTDIVWKAHEVKRKDGTMRQVPERRRTISRVSNGEINRELTLLKRCFNLALQAGKILHVPHVPLLKETNVRTGFFEAEQFRSVRAHLPAAIQPVVTFAYLTGWRITSEVLPLEWRNVDFKASEIRLDAGTTKNGEGRVFVFSDDLRELLEAQHADHVRLKKAGQVVPWVFFRLVAKGRGGQKTAKRITSFSKAWDTACKDAGCPGRIPHDLRRTAIRNMVRRGVVEAVAMKLTGHKTRSVFDRYNIVSDSDLGTAAAQLNGLMGPATGPNEESEAKTPRRASALKSRRLGS
jgi:integrase